MTEFEIGVFGNLNYNSLFFKLVLILLVRIYVHFYAYSNLQK